MILQSKKIRPWGGDDGNVTLTAIVNVVRDLSKAKNWVQNYTRATFICAKKNK